MREIEMYLQLNDVTRSGLHTCDKITSKIVYICPERRFKGAFRVKNMSCNFLEISVQSDQKAEFLNLTRNRIRDS